MRMRGMQNEADGERLMDIADDGSSRTKLDRKTVNTMAPE